MMAEDRAQSLAQTLDPEDWDAMRVLGHRMVDDLLEHMRTIRERPPWQHAPPEVKAHFTNPVPLDPQPPEAVYEEFSQLVLPYPLSNTHPRFWGWVGGTGTVVGALAEFLASAMNSSPAAFSYHSAVYVEHQVIDWIKQMMGYPADASGLLTSGCSEANMTGLAVARHAKAGFDVRAEGLQGVQRNMVLYTSQESHSSVQKAVELLGLGHRALRVVPVNDALQIDLQALREAIRRDRQNGHLPFCVVGVAGTTNTGSIDDLDGLADICQQEDLWLHVDGAFGAWTVLVDRYKHLVAGMERADSLALDLHKWMYMPFEIGCVLVRSEALHRQAFSLTPAYLAHGEGERGLTGVDMPWLSDYTYNLTRKFRGLKAWMSLKVHGLRKYAALIEQNIAQAHYLADLIAGSPRLELSSPVAINALCFRYVRDGLDDAALDTLNHQIEIEMQERGIAVVSSTRLRGRLVLHLAITNHRSRRDDFDALVEAVLAIGDELG